MNNGKFETDYERHRFIWCIANGKEWDDDYPDDEEWPSLSETLVAKQPWTWVEEETGTCKILEKSSDISTESFDFTERGARRNTQIAKIVAEAKQLIVLDGSTVYTRMDDGEFYLPLTNKQLAVEIERCIPEQLSATLSSKAIMEIIDKIKRAPDIQKVREMFNANVYQINCANGVVEVGGGSVNLRMHHSDDMFDYSIKANYIYADERGEANTFERFCQTTFKVDVFAKRKLLLEFIGYICSDSMAGKCMLLGIGAPNSGKSVAAKFIEGLFRKENISSIAPHELTTDFAKARLFGKKVNILAEISSKDLKGVDVLKSLTSGDTVTGAYKGQDSFEFPNKAKLVFFANNFPLPAELDPTDGFYNRLVILLFPFSIAKEDQDPHLLEKLLKEKDIIFSLAVDAYAELMLRNFEFTKPEDSVRYLKGYKDEMNSFQLFMQDCLVMAPNERVHSVTLFASYSRYCKENGLTELKDAEVRMILKSLPGVNTNKFLLNGENRRGYRGIGLQDKAFAD